MAFVDVKAFDRVPRKVIWWALRKLSVEEWIVRLVQGMYANARSCVRVGEQHGGGGGGGRGECTTFFAPQMGSHVDKQFCMYAETLPRSQTILYVRLDDFLGRAAALRLFLRPEPLRPPWA